METTKSSNWKRCGACLQSSMEQMYSLPWTKIVIDEIEHTLIEIYQQCIQLPCEDSYFNWVCQTCHNKLVDYFQFRKMCVESYNILQQANYDSFKIEPVDIVDSIEMPEEKDVDMRNIQVGDAEICVDYEDDVKENVATIEDENIDEKNIVTEYKEIASDSGNENFDVDHEVILLTIEMHVSFY